MAGIFREYLIDTDAFGQPKTVYSKKAIGVLIVRLLLLEPGTDPMRPEMGVGIVSRYRYMFPTRITELQNNIADQLAKYLFPYQRVDISMEVIDKELRMKISIDDDTYQYVTKEQEDNNTVTLTELIADTELSGQ